jgi:phage shock protein E
MNWVEEIILLAAVVVLYLVWKRSTQISATDAAEHLKSGALLIDVRTPAEFKSGHLPNAINLPLAEIESALPLRVKDKNQVLLLHCQSGVRSGVARSKLKSLGYANTFNLGSYSRAARIVRDK